MKRYIHYLDDQKLLDEFIVAVIDTRDMGIKETDYDDLYEEILNRMPELKRIADGID